MPRRAREKSESGIYHIILRGHNRQTIFEDNEDKEKFLKTLSDCQGKSGFGIYGYCLMGNHIHLLLHEMEEELGIIMRRIGASYVYWYNRKYKRCGHLFQDRYRSEAVEDDAYYLTVLRYIHRNPVKAGLVRKMPDYKWSSYNDYIDNSGITDIDFTLNMINEDRVRAKEEFIIYHKEQTEDKCLEMEESFRLTDEEAEDIIRKKYDAASGMQLRSFEREKRDRCLRELKEEGLSTRQIERITGINRSIILKI